MPEDENQRPPGPEARAEVPAADQEFQRPAGMGSTQSRPGPGASATYACELVQHALRGCWCAVWLSDFSEIKELRVQQKTSLSFLISARLRMS